MAPCKTGKWYFFTATILNWKKLLADNRCKQIIIDEWKRLVELRQIEVGGFVIMPIHYHIIWSVCEGYAPQDVQRDFHKRTSRQLIKWMKEYQPQMLAEFVVAAKDRNIQIWERNPLPIELFTSEVIRQKLEYIHNNPCYARWRLSERPEQYHYSSERYYLLNKDEWGFIANILV